MQFGCFSHLRKTVFELIDGRNIKINEINYKFKENISLKKIEFELMNSMNKRSF